MRLLATTLIVFLLSPVAYADLVGVASVVDGDTLEIHGERIRLIGIDAPEASQLCTLEGKKYPCGRKAALALADKIGRKTVTCRGKSRDRYDRLLAVCSIFNMRT